MLPVTDWDNTMKRGETSAGRGSIDFKEIFSHSEKAGVEHFFDEMDESSAPGKDLRASFACLKDLRF
jgi:sugar phosphate isomerase/epimerase